MQEERLRASLFTSIYSSHSFTSTYFVSRSCFLLTLAHLTCKWLNMVRNALCAHLTYFNRVPAFENKVHLF